MLESLSHVSPWVYLNIENAFFKIHHKKFADLLFAKHFIDIFHWILTATLQIWHYYNHFPD